MRPLVRCIFSMVVLCGSVLILLACSNGSNNSVSPLGGAEVGNNADISPINVESTNLALGAFYTIEPAAQYKLTRDKNDDIQLTDGHYVQEHFWSSEETVGWQKSGPITIEIDLGATRSIERVCVNTARGDHAEVSFPDHVEIFVSSDKKQYSALGDLYQDGPHEGGSYLVKKFCRSNLVGNGRYILLVVQPKGRFGFVFIDEIEVLGGNVNEKTNQSKTTLANREGIREFLRLRNNLRNRRKAFIRMAKGFSKIVGGNTRNRTKSLIDQLGQEPSVDSEILGRFEDALLLLHRLEISKNFKEELIVWRKNPWAVFNQMDTPTPDTLIKDGLNFDLMKRGSASNAFILTNNSDRQKNLKIVVEIEKIVDIIPAFEVSEVIPVITASHDIIGDALKPVKNGLISIKPGESKQVWVTVLAGEAIHGEYFYKIKVISDQGNHPEKVVALDVKIWPAMFPDQQQVFVNVWPYLNLPLIAHIPEIASEDLFIHHVNVSVLHPEQIPWPKLGADGWWVDYSVSDEALDHLKGVRKRLFFLIFNDEMKRSFGGKLKFMSMRWKQVFKKWIMDWTTHLQERGLDYRDFAFYPVDEPGNGDEVTYLLETAKLIKEVDPRLEVYTTLGAMGVFDLVQVRNVVDIFQVPIRDLDRVGAMGLKAMDKEIWTYSARGGKTASPLSYYRSQGWKAFRGGATGIGFWAYADKGGSGTAWNDFDGRGPDYAVIYEGQDTILSSKRWESWREGVEDFELLRLARQKVSSPDEARELGERIDKILNNMNDYPEFESIKKYILGIASR